MGKNKLGIAQLFTSHRNDLQPVPARLPLAISSPFGPVKNSRGPDLIRSDDFIIVDAIKDCGTAVNSSEGVPLGASKPDKKMGIGIVAKRTLLKRQSLVALTSTPKSDSHSAATTPRCKNFDEVEMSLSVSKLESAATSTTSLFTVNHDHEYTHTSKPQKPRSPLQTQNKFATKLPKSRTMSVLQDIKNSVPRRTHFPTSASKTLSKRSDPNLKQAGITTMDRLRSRRRLSREESAPSSRHSCTTNITTPDPGIQCIDHKQQVEALPGQITNAQTSAYWSGRFTALRDRFSTEHMEQVLAQAGDTLQAGIAHHPHSQDNHDAEPNGNPQYPLRDEDSICLQVFAHLKSQCVTATAQASLRRWQEKYARRHHRPSILPYGTPFMGESLVSRRFASHSRYQDREGLAFLEDAYYSNASNAFGITNPHSVEARYLNFR
ncbi:hypothetical protein NQ176_g10698 [Zarea fungicola]|uniref:Uncharacterized protein n=1 Tax=Zarea fungicola TaxID=93591 RepID=A0ACC1ME01_9HYPO|nr:hypothetical protein NQ176_g10698 [Lecanicillium fungicola]